MISAVPERPMTKGLGDFFDGSSASDEPRSKSLSHTLCASVHNLLYFLAAHMRAYKTKQ